MTFVSFPLLFIWWNWPLKGGLYQFGYAIQDKLGGDTIVMYFHLSPRGQ